MFTLEQIKTAHGKVKSGADFPAYINDISKLGVRKYETFVTDGHTVYYGNDDYKTTAPAQFETSTIADESDAEKFQSELKAHQQGKTDFLTFIGMTAKMGVGKWVVDIDKMTCTYFDKKGNPILVEAVPQK